MANTIICYISIKDVVKDITSSLTSDYIYNFVKSVKAFHSDIRIASSLSDIDRLRNCAFSAYDNIIFYQDNGPICLGKWATSTILNTASHNNDQGCNNLTELFTKLKEYSNEDRLQEADTACGKRNESKGIAIEVTRSCATVESRQIGNGTIISC